MAIAFCSMKKHTVVKPTKRGRYSAELGRFGRRTSIPKILGRRPQRFVPVVIEENCTPSPKSKSDVSNSTEVGRNGAQRNDGNQTTISFLYIINAEQPSP